MGANTFTHYANGANANDAFQDAVDDARHEYGHGGYTGTIAEKDSFVMMKPEEDTSAWSKGDYENWADKIIKEDHPKIADKWGPAGCVQISAEEFIFFGWASS